MASAQADAVADVRGRFRRNRDGVTGKVLQTELEKQQRAFVRELRSFTKLVIGAEATGTDAEQAKAFAQRLLRQESERLKESVLSLQRHQERQTPQKKRMVTPRKLVFFTFLVSKR